MDDRRAFDPLGGRIATPIIDQRVCIDIPVALIPMLLGALEPLRWPDAWTGEPQSINATTGEIENLFKRLITREACPNNCPDCPDCPDCPSDHSGQSGACCGSTDEECEDMGQVVTDVQIVDGQIRVFFGPCCWKDLGSIAELAGGGGELPEDMWEIPGEEPPTYDPCGKAYAVQQVVNKIVEASFSAMGELPWNWVKYVQNQVGYDLDNNWLGILLANVRAGTLAGDSWENAYDAIEHQAILCKLVSAFAGDGAGVPTSDAFEDIKSIFKSEMWPDSHWQYWDQAINALGRSDMDTAAKLGATDTTRDCGCPETNPEEFYGLVAWARTVQSIGREDGTFTPVGRTAGGLTYEYSFQSANGGVKALTFDHYFDIDPAADITELTVALEPIAPTDELLHRNWDASGCSNLNELEDVNGEMFPSSTGVTRRYKWDNGRFYYQWTKTTPAQAIFWRVSEGRVCPSDSTNNPGKLYRWKAHIVSVNNVDTGVVPDTTWP